MKRNGNKTSKFIRAYGMILPKLAKKYGMSNWYIYSLHLKGELHDFIKEQDEKKESTDAPAILRHP